MSDQGSNISGSQAGSHAGRSSSEEAVSLAERLAAVWRNAEARAREESLAILQRAGLSGADTLTGSMASLGSLAGRTAAEELAAEAASRPKGSAAERASALAEMLAKFVEHVDRVAWGTWKEVAPRSDVKRPAGFEKMLAQFARGGGEATREQVEKDLDRLRALAAALMSSIRDAGRQMAREHAEKFAPKGIEQTVGGGVMGRDARCWRKYKELWGAMDADELEAELRQAVTRDVERMVIGRR